jgi:hypothetical protein
MTAADPTAAPPAAEQARPPRRRLRTAAAILLGVLACLALVVTTTAVWVHQVALNTDRWVSLSSQVIEDPAVIASLSDKVSQQVVDALDVQGRLETALPQQSKLLAGPITGAVQDRLRQGLARLMASPEFQSAWAQVNRFAHTQLVAVLRDDLTGVTIENGVVTLNLLPLVGSAVAQLQADGIIPATVSLPDLSGTAAPAAARAALQSALGTSLPADFGTVTLARADRLEAAQTAVRIFDVVVVLAIVITILLFVGAAFLARDRRRAVVLLGAGAVVALLVARAAIRGVENAIVNSITDDSGATAARGIFDAVLDDLFGVMVVVTIVGAIVGIVAWLVGRREQIAQIAAEAGATARRAAASGVETGGAAASGAAGRVGAAGAVAGGGVVAAGVSLRDRARPHLGRLRLAGVVVAVVVLAIVAVGWEAVAVIGALLAIYEVGINALADAPTDGSVEIAVAAETA